MKAPGAPLGSILARRIAFFAILAMIVQLAVVVSDYYWNDDELSRLFVERETEGLAAGLGNGSFRLPDRYAGRYGAPGRGYAARVRASDGPVLFSSCDHECEEHFLPLDLRPPTFWLRTITPGKPLTLAGGRSFTVDGHAVLVEVVTLGDPDDVVSDVLLHEIVDHMIVPMGLLLLLVLGGTLLSVRQALMPVRAAALAADAIDPLDQRSKLPTEGMPREIAHLADAVNRAFARIGELMRSQRLLTSGIAHEVRTPLAAVQLELGHIDHPRARKAEADIEELARFVQQLTALARLESFDHAAFTPVDLGDLATEVVETLAPWVYDSGHSLALEVSASRSVPAVAPLLKDAVRNLVENAVRHAAARRAIVVRVTAAVIEVEDDGAAGDGVVARASPATATTGGLGIGLRIVQRIALLHRARFAAAPTATGFLARLEFGDAPGDVAPQQKIASDARDHSGSA
ncbi:ATP-binding protein [Methylobrevis pamukkalensis]|uniref:histidine kinase n=1 Tax=Methylobrevis pamukkalensis TaxID=1439726 RepID=A0A1E3GX89_9HYPH|nr:ATP-binding protein [Methylobrevis pamukkalensis]ODN68672.1 Sensor protein QseC [Methylobrevis pamukkalensis]